MRPQGRVVRSVGRGMGAVFLFGAWCTTVAWAGGKAPASDPLARGRALFLRTWEPDDRRGHGGDGLGPVFNDRSCVACHNQGGPGGAGSASKNVDVVSIVFNPPERGSLMKIDLAGIEAIHVGFATSRSIVLHRFGTSPSYESWRRGWMTGDLPEPSSNPRSRSRQEPEPLPLDRPASLPKKAQRGSFQLQRSQRNSTALFGAGLIDSIPDEVIKNGVRLRLDPSQVQGRVARLKDGRIGRFGWKAQMASLEDFVLTACSVEVGLEVPGHQQAGDPGGYGRRPEGLDMTSSECDDLVAYVRNLPSPVARTPSNALGRKLFESIGCTDCHVPKLGDVEGIYSDLLLHDMGDELEGTGGYGTTPPSPGEEIPEPGSLAISGSEAGKVPAKPAIGAGRREWRTPPLWGVRDSAPYMHDGRAPTLEKVIALHQGDSRDSAARYRDLPEAKQHQLLQFLKSLAAPRQVAHKGLP
jgi:CxxC motif-containing protein (DUF1111 family)